MSIKRQANSLVAVFGILIPVSAVAQNSNAVPLPSITVTATPLNRDVSETAQSATVLSEDSLAREQRNSIGETLARQPGVNNASFGENVGRPVIRGFQGTRVGVLNNSMSSADASSFSQDHAVPTEPLLLDQVEVLRGPATLSFGSGAIGGVVNMVSGAIPGEVPEDGFDGQLILQGDSAADEGVGAANLTFGEGTFAGNFSGFYRRSDDYEIPGEAELFPEEGEEEESTGVLENSFVDNEGGSIGGNWFGEQWQAGLSFSLYDSNYGIPGGHGHGHEEEHGDEEHEGEEHDEEDHDEEEESVTIELENRRFDGQIIGEDPFSGIQRLQLNLAETDYDHTEFEGSEVGTVFDIETTDVRLELQHNPISQWIGEFGAQFTDREFSALGEEAFVPPSMTETLALFLVESAEFGWGRLDLGARYENVDVDSEELEHGHEDEHEEEEHEEHEEHEEGHGTFTRDFEPISFSAAAVIDVGEQSDFVLTFANAERAPTDAELFSNGPHIATQTFEIGDANLDKETNRHFEIAYRMRGGPVTGNFSLYYDDFEDYIYLAGTGEEEDGFPVRQWSQQNAEFTGGELELRWDFGETSAGNWELFGFYDWVKAELDDGSNVPLIPPQRFGLGIDWSQNRWQGNVTWINADDHTDTAEFETSTPGYDLLNAELAYTMRKTTSQVSFFIKGNNLLDEDIRYSTSSLKDQAPQKGLNFVLGARMNF